LRALSLTGGPITVLGPIGEEQPAFRSFLVSWEVPNLETQRRDRVTGQLNLPNGSGPYPVIIMLRGYVDREIYQTGTGTKNAAAELAKNGFVTIAPDFLGYGGSDAESNDVLISRFVRPVTVLQLLKNLDNLRLEVNPAGSQAATLLNSQLVGRTIDTTRVGLWAHSNGGQIALSVLEITSRILPTTLWAPVSQPFPYSVLYYSNEQADGGKYLRRQLADFEFTLGNEPADFSALKEPSRILAPVQIHQGGRDEAVPLAWSESLLEKLEDATVSAKLYTYPSADHNLQPDWKTVVQRDLQFFAKYLKK
jgi:dienelactone hydrolase